MKKQSSIDGNNNKRLNKKIRIKKRDESISNINKSKENLQDSYLFT